MNPPHDFAMAIFAITLDDNALQLKVKIDREDMEKALIIETKNKDVTDLIVEYISDHTIWIINNQPITFNYHSIKKNEDFYFLETQPIVFNAPFSTIDLYNSCLIEEINKQSNVIYIKQKNKELRGFRMNKNRVQISVDL